MNGNTAILGTEIYNRDILNVLNLTHLNNSTLKINNNSYVIVHTTLTDDMANKVTGRNIFL